MLPVIILGGLLPVVCATATGYLIAPRTPLPRSIRFTTGAAAFSLMVFAILSCHAGFAGVYVGIGLAAVALLWRQAAAVTARPAAMPWFFRVVFGAAGIAYLINALAPEIQADAAGYHLRLVSDYVRLHTFSNRIGFFDLLPQGMEMLFVPAFAIGGGSAAKLVAFAFLLASVGLIREIAREAGLENTSACAAAAIFFLAPVCGVAGTSAYTDAGLVCACCALVYLVIRWQREGSQTLLLCAALNAAFCFAVKPNFGWVAVAAFVCLRLRLAFAGLVVMFVAPWLARAYWMAPEVITVDLMQRLSATYGAFRPGFAWQRAYLDYTVLGGNQGFFGPAFLLLPFGLLALRRRWGRVLSGAVLVLAVPFLANTGARFLMPAMAIGSVLIALVLPVPVAIGMVMVQSAAAVFDQPSDWRLEGVPLAAALRITPEHVYLSRKIPGYGIVDEITSKVPAGSKILACTPLAESYVPREILTYWQSRSGQQMTDNLEFAFISHGTRARLFSWRWAKSAGTAIRLTALSDIRASTGSSWRRYRPKDKKVVAAPAGLRMFDLLVWPGDQAQLTADVMYESGKWCNVDSLAERFTYDIDLRLDATAYIRRMGYRYLVIPVADDPFARLGSDMLRHSVEWGVEVVGRSGNLYLFRL